MPERADFPKALLRASSTSTLAVAARYLAMTGVPVFPCQANGKRPITARGFHDASTDLAKVEVWWSRTPEANVGVPTGALSGMVVVDVDLHGLVDGRLAFARAEAAGLVGGWGLLVETPTGGVHAYFAAKPGVEQRSWQSACAGVDFRGDGGYIIVSPSVRIIGGAHRRYEVADINDGSAGTVDAARLRDFLDPRPVPVAARVAGLSRGADASRLASWMAGRGEGERNRSLFWAACRLAENGVPAADALDVMTAAAGQAGLGDREIVTTVRSAYRIVHPTPGGAGRGGDAWFERTDARASVLGGRGL